MTFKDLAIRLKPAIRKKHLIFVASFVWFFAGGMLLFRGIKGMSHGGWHFRSLTITLLGGLLFFVILFQRISLKHINRIRSLTVSNPCAFSFFNLKSYLLMAVMITMGVTIRKLHLTSNNAISYFFITMSVPLLISATRFFRAWRRYSC